MGLKKKNRFAYLLLFCLLAGMFIGIKTAFANLHLLMVADKGVCECAPAMAFEEKDVFLWPLIGEITSGYGERIHPMTGKKEFHPGIDIGGAVGASVLAVKDGVVTFAGWQGDYGLLVTIDHGEGLETRYGHLSSYEKAVGADVDKGEILGFVGETGMTTGPHLHFEVRLEGERQDPGDYLPLEDIF